MSGSNNFFTLTQLEPRQQFANLTWRGPSMAVVFGIG
jgi:hypothetical protein